MAAQTILAAHTKPEAPTTSTPEVPYNAIVTGGANGIGAATVRKIASRGINVLIADMSIEGKSLAQQVKDEYGVDAVYQHVDIRREEDIDMMIKIAVQRWGRIDYGANIAGICQDGGEIREGEIKACTDLVDRHYEINQRGTWLLQRAQAQQMLSQEPRPITTHPPTSKAIKPQRGSIVNVSSTSALTGQGFPAYSPSKAAILQITRNGAYYYGKHGIRCNSIAPGAVVTNLGVNAMPASIREAFLENDERLAEKVPLGTFAWPEEVANVISFLLSAESSHVSGTNIEVDGGLSNTSPI